MNIFRAILDDRILNLTNKIKEKQRSLGKKEEKELFAIEEVTTVKSRQQHFEILEQLDKRAKKERERLTQEKGRLIEIRSTLRKETKPFIWDIDFVEIFADEFEGGFDIVIGNPPYVRQEKIADPKIPKEKITNENKREYKEKLFYSIQSHFPFIKSLSKKSDLYIYFYFQGLSLLNQTGTFCFITSNSWLDVDYGKELQEFLLNNAKIHAIYDNSAKRSFARADINTIIAVFSTPKPKEKKENLENLAKFVMFKKPFDDVLTTDNLLNIEEAKEITKTNDFRVYPKRQVKLLEEGWEYPEDITEEQQKIYKFNIGKYAGNKWGGKYLRAPDIFFKILEKGKDKLVRLGDIADVRRGLVTGLDKYLILNEPEIKRFALDKKYFKKILTYPRETTTIKFSSNDINRWCLNIDKNDIRKPELKRFIDFCLEGGAKNLSTVKSKKYWYVIDQQIKRPFLIIFRVPYLTFGAYLVNDDILVNDALIICGENVIDYLIFFNSIVCFLELLILSRAYTKTLGVMKIERVDLEKIDVIKINYKKLKIFHRPIINIFEECGINPRRPIRDQEPNPLPDRKELDDIIFDILGLTKEERKEVYWAVCELVKNRLEKARSV